jgi:hypothetical protein
VILGAAFAAWPERRRVPVAVPAADPISAGAAVPASTPDRVATAGPDR